jgi:DNA-binding CsgD family transcriptional regulator
MPDALARGREALARGAWTEARTAFEEALAAEESAEALEGLAHASVWDFDAEPVTAALDRGYALYRRSGDPAGAARVAMWLALVAFFLHGQPAVGRGWLERAGRLLDGLEPTAEHGWLAAWRAHLELVESHDVARARDLAGEALGVGRAIGDLDVEMLGLSQQGLVLVSCGDVAEGMRRLDEATAAALAGELTDWRATSQVCCYLIYACKRVRDYERAAEWCDKVKELSVRFGDRMTFAACRTHYADILILRGSWAEADAELALNVAELGGMNPKRAVDGLARLAELRRRQGRLDEAVAFAAEAEGHHLTPLVRAAIAIDQGEAATAVELAERALRRIPVEERTERALGLELLVRAHAEHGDDTGARTALAELRDIAAAVGTTPLKAAVASAEGIVDQRAGDAEAARRRFEDAVDLYGSAGMPFEAALARLGLAESLLAAERPQPAADEAHAALAALRSLGAAREAARAAALLERLGVAAGPQRDLETGLTAREREVLRLVAKGRSNQEIAAELVLSVRTVERHISNIYDKIGAAGKVARATAAAYALSHGLG